MNNNFKYYRVSQSHEESLRSPTTEIVCQTDNLEEAQEALNKLNKEFYQIYVKALTNAHKEFCVSDLNDTRPKSEISFEEVQSIYDNYGDYWNHKPKIDPIEIKFFNRLQK